MAFKAHRLWKNSSRGEERSFQNPERPIGEVARRVSHLREGGDGGCEAKVLFRRIVEVHCRISEEDAWEVEGNVGIIWCMQSGNPAWCI